MMNYVLVVMGSLILICSLIVMDLERDVKASNIKGFGDALWWSITTVTTVGYGDRFPVTAGGRAVAAVLMIGGIALLGVVTSSITAFFVEQNRDRGKSTATEAEISHRLEVIEALLGQLTVRLPAQAAPTSTPQITFSDWGL